MSVLGFRVWLAIDLLGGKAVRLRQGRPETAWVVSDKPVELAQKWVAEGGRRLHLVDLDAALGTGENRSLIRAICRTTTVPVQVGGGVRDEEGYWELRELGASRVMVGSLAVRHPERVATLAQSDPHGLVVAADVRDGRVAVHGWREESLLPLAHFAGRMRSLGVGHLLVTGIDRDGTGEGPEIALLQEALRVFGPGVLAAGGVGCREHLASLRNLAPAGLEGVVVGAAVARGQLTMGDLLAGELVTREEDGNGSVSNRSLS